MSSLSLSSSVELKNGVRMPMYGFGLSHNDGGFNADAVSTAMQSGSRPSLSLSTTDVLASGQVCVSSTRPRFQRDPSLTRFTNAPPAQRYRTESQLRQAWTASGIPREEFFFTTKARNTEKQGLISSSAAVAWRLPGRARGMPGIMR